MTRIVLRVLLLLSFTTMLAAREQATGPTGDPLAGWKSRAELDALVASLRSGELEGEQAIFRREDGPYRVYTSFIDNRRGIADIHEKDDEIFVVISGSARSTLGGTLVASTRRSRYELRGTHIAGGSTRQVGVGDIISAPRGTAHQMDATGGHILYIVIKVIGRPNS